MIKFLAIFLLGSLALAGPTSQTYTGTVTPASPTLTIPAAVGPITSITVTLDNVLIRSYQIQEMSGEAPGIIHFNYPISFQGARLLSPLGGSLCFGQINVPTTTVTVPPGGGTAPFADAPYTWSSTQTTSVNPAEYTAGPNTFTIQYPRQYTVLHESGFVRARQNASLSTTVTITYN